MIRILNLLVLILNTFVLIAGQFPNDVTDTQEYRNLVYILIIALILLILTDIFQGISEFILSFTRYEENKTLISSAVGIFLALITSYILFNLPLIQTILNAIK